MGRRCLPRPVWMSRVSLVTPVILVTALTAYLGLALTARTVHACSCLDVPLSEYAEDVAIAFSGSQIERIISEPEGSTRSSADPVTLIFRVNRMYKGRAGPLIEVQTVRGEMSCGVNFPRKAITGVAAFSRGGDEYAVGLCGSPVTIGELEEVFGEGYPPDEIFGLQQDVAGLKEDSADLEEEVLSLQTEVSNLRDEVSNLRDSASTMTRILLAAGSIVIIGGLVAVFSRKRRDPG